jgi:ParB family transcriptional regulator, chromosome partitioning protein
MTTQPRERRLGKGLDGLIGLGKPTAESGSVSARIVTGAEKIQLDKIDPNPWQPRREFGEAELEDLIRSIQLHGVLQPIILRRLGDRFQLIAGERRWRASQELGTGSISAVVVTATDREMLEWSIVENAQRADLNPIETAMAFRRLMTEFSLTQEDVAERVGQSRSHVANTLRLLDLPDEIKDLVSRGTITAGAGRALLAVKSPADRLRLAREAAAGNVTVRQLEGAATGKPKPVNAIRAGVPDPNLAEVADQLQTALAMRVKISGTPKRGSVAISYHSASELGRIHRLLMVGTDTLGAEPEDQSDAITV